jgi:hypothetical protein
VAVRVSGVDVSALCGVPVIAPVDALSERPEGRAGEIVYVVTAPPEFEIVYGVASTTPTVPLAVLDEMVIDGATPVIVTVVVPELEL